MSLGVDSLKVACPTCGMPEGVPCVKTSVEVGRFKRVQKYFTAPHQKRVTLYWTTGSIPARVVGRSVRNRRKK